MSKIWPAVFIMVAAVLSGGVAPAQKYAAFQVFEFDPAKPQVTNIGAVQTGQSWKEHFALQVKRAGPFPVLISCTKNAKPEQLSPVITMFQGLGVRETTIEFTDLDWNEIAGRNHPASGWKKE